MSEAACFPDKALTQWLETLHRALSDDLATVLDLEAGLRAALMPARHADLVADLGGSAHRTNPGQSRKKPWDAGSGVPASQGSRTSSRHGASECYTVDAGSGHVSASAQVWVRGKPRRHLERHPEYRIDG